MAVFEKEFYTNKAISKPSRKFFGMEDEELAFIILYFMFFIVFIMVFLGMVPSIFKIKIPIETINNVMVIFGFYTPSTALTMLKIFKAGKQTGYINQKLYIFFTSSADSTIDSRDSDKRLSIKKLTEKSINFINNPNNPINKNKDKKDFIFSSESSNKKIKDDYLKSKLKHEIYIKRKKR